MSGWPICVLEMCRVKAWVASLTGAWVCCGCRTALVSRQALTALAERQ